MTLSRRPERDDDASFRFRLFEDVHGENLRGIEGALRDLLLRQQFAGQTMTYREAYPGARFDIVEFDGTPVGRIVTDHAVARVLIVDIALLAAWRGRGLGTRLLHDILAEARATGRPVDLSVRATNADAVRLYRRLGFQETAASVIDVEMRWSPVDGPNTRTCAGETLIVRSD